MLAPEEVIQGFIQWCATNCRDLTSNCIGFVYPRIGHSSCFAVKDRCETDKEAHWATCPTTERAEGHTNASCFKIFKVYTIYKIYKSYKINIDNTKHTNNTQIHFPKSNIFENVRKAIETFQTIQMFILLYIKFP